MRTITCILPCIHIYKAIAIANPNFKATDRTALKEEFERLKDEGQIVFTTFHQSMSYEDFVEGIKPKVDDLYKKH